MECVRTNDAVPTVEASGLTSAIELSEMLMVKSVAVGGAAPSETVTSSPGRERTAAATTPASEGRTG